MRLRNAGESPGDLEPRFQKMLVPWAGALGLILGDGKKVETKPTARGSNENCPAEVRQLGAADRR